MTGSEAAAIAAISSQIDRAVGAQSFYFYLWAFYRKKARSRLWGGGGARARRAASARAPPASATRTAHARDTLVLSAEFEI